MFQGPGWEFAKFFTGVPGKRKPAGAMHLIGNRYVEFEGADIAFSEAYYATRTKTLPSRSRFKNLRLEGPCCPRGA